MQYVREWGWVLFYESDVYVYVWGLGGCDVCSVCGVQCTEVARMVVCWCVYQVSILLFVVGGQRSPGGRWGRFGKVCAVGVRWCESHMWRCVM